jgi:hypothetical protein
VAEGNDHVGEANLQQQQGAQNTAAAAAAAAAADDASAGYAAVLQHWLKGMTMCVRPTCNSSSRVHNTQQQQQQQ